MHSQERVKIEEVLHKGASNVSPTLFRLLCESLWVSGSALLIGEEASGLSKVFSGPRS